MVIALISLHVALQTLTVQGAEPDDLKKQTPEQLKAGIERKHPATYYILASKLFADANKDDAVLWFYVGQLRY